MFLRFTYFQSSPDTISQARKVYEQEVVPVVMQQKGIIAIRLLEPTNPSDDYISMTEWESKEAAEAYEASGTYKAMVSKLNAFITRPPVLKTYEAKQIPIAST